MPRAIALANGTPFGLVAGVWSGDGSRAMRVAREARVGLAAMKTLVVKHG